MICKKTTNCSISVALTTYNGAAYLREQLDSIYNQTILPSEVIAVDDCSTDSTLSILEEYSQRYGLKFYKNEKNIGYNKNFEKAISLCNGNYIAFSDQDDVWFPTKIEVTLSKLKDIEGDGPALVSCSFVSNIHGDEIVYRDKRYMKDANTIESLLASQCCSNGCSMIFNRALVPYILPFADYPEFIFDWYILCTAAMVGSIYCISEPLFFYRRHANNCVARINKRIKRPFIERLQRNLYTYDRYPFLLYDAKFYALSPILERHKEVIPHVKQTYVNIFIHLFNSRNLLKNWCTIAKLSAISRKEKQKLLLHHTIAYCFHLFFSPAIRK